MLVPWKRFWVPLGESIHCGPDGRGFLDDPESQFGKHLNANVVSLGELRDRPCLVLLGEPGMGKTSTIDTEKPELERIYGTANCVWVRFRDIPDNQTFIRRVFDSAEWRNWAAGSHKLFLVIDGIDEGLLKIPEFVSFLRSELERTDRSRLHLILICRIANWPQVAGSELLALWPGDEKKKTFELCPLRQVDVHHAAQVQNLDPETFVRAVYETNIVGLAQRPVTLFMLLRAYARAQRFPGTYRDLYQQGCQILCSEVNQGRIEQMRPRLHLYSLPSEEQKLTIAKRIAALMMLSGKSAVYLGAPDQSGPTDLSLGEIATGIERVNGSEFTVSDSWVLETLSTALFNHRGENRLGFAHQTFAEALAASHLIKLPLAQVRTLLCQRDATKQHIVPQLAEVSAWLAGEHHEFLDFLLTNEPEILLRSDIALISPDHKRRLVTSLLEAAKKEEVFDSTDRFYAALNYDGMAQELIGTIQDKNCNFIARRMAIDIAGACKVAHLMTPLLDLIRDAVEENNIKRHAANALADLTPLDRLAELVPLAEGALGADPDDELRGSALQALVPRFTNVRTAVPWLARPISNTLGGRYWMVLHYHLPRFIEASDLPALFGLIVDRSSCFDTTSAFKEIADKTFCEATKRLDDPAIAEGFVTAWLSKVREHGPLPLSADFKFNAIFREQADMRRRIIELILTSPQATVQDAHRTALTHRSILSAQDLPWLLERLPNIPAAAKPNWIEVLRWQVFPESVVPCWDLFLESMRQSPELQHIYSDLFRAWDPEEPIARKAKADWLREKRSAARFRRAAPPPREPKIRELVETSVSGNPKAWLDLSQWLFLEDGHSRVDGHKMDLLTAPGWLEADDTRREQICAIARDFLINCSDPPHQAGTITIFTIAGFKAVVLLDAEVRGSAILREAIRTKWLAALFDVPWDDECFKKAIALGFDLSPEACSRELEETYVDDPHDHRFTTILRALKSRWNAELSEIAKNLLLQYPRPDSIHHVIEFLVKVDREAAVGTLRALLSILDVSPDDDLFRNAFAAGIANLADEMWPTIYEVLKSNRELTRLVFLHVANHNDASNQVLKLTSDPVEIAELYIFLREIFPPSEDPPIHGNLGARWAAARFRDEQLTNLSSSGTMEACRALLDLAVRFRQESIWFRWRHKECLNVARTRLWTPYPPKQILQLVEKGTNRLIANEGDLIEVVLESLERLETALVGVINPQVIDLWNYQGGGTTRHGFAPKDEEDLSGKIAGWLQTDLGPSRGLILNREVQPRRGLRTDVLVDAVALDQVNTSRLTIVIEVKGCWNSEVPTAIQEQLIDDYLAPPWLDPRNLPCRLVYVRPLGYHG